jgi:hypothetical protein
MPAPGTPPLPRSHAELDAFLQRALLLDLEVSPHGRIRRIGAVLGAETFAQSGDALSGEAGAALARLAASATCVLGHNLARHDLPALRQAAPRHPLLRLPVLDTLVLSPLCFPENPYHRLVKDYKLVRESLNDPVADARQAAVLFRDEYAALAGLRQTEPRLFGLLHFLLATPDERGDLLADGMHLLFQSLAGSPLCPPPTPADSDPADIPLTRPRSRGGTLSRPTGEGRGEGESGESGRRPPSSSRCAHSASLTGMTESRDCRMSGRSFKAGSCLMAARPTGRIRASIGSRSTATHAPSVAVGSGYADRATRATPTTSRPSPLW